MEALLIGIAVLGAGAHVVATLQIYEFLKTRNAAPEPFVLIRWYTFRYVNRYKELTRQETGKVGPLFWVWVLGINVALVCFVVILIRILAGY